MATFMYEEKETTFRMYKEFKQKFLKCFMNFNLINNAIKKLMNLRQRKILILKYYIKV